MGEEAVIGVVNIIGHVEVVVASGLGGRHSVQVVVAGETKGYKCSMEGVRGGGGAVCECQDVARECAGGRRVVHCMSLTLTFPILEL